jgi:hypothetical protein
MTATLTEMATTSTNGLTATFETVTPEVAEKWLRHNNRNRPMSNTEVGKHARDMKAGNWLQTGQTIGFDWNGNLTNGQHRLQAIVLSGVPQQLLVVRGLDPRAQDVTDIGKKRTIADALHLEGLAKVRPGQLGSIARAVLLAENAPTNDPKYRPTQAEVLERVRAEQEEFEYAAYVMGRAHSAGLRGGMIYGVAYYYLARKNADAAAEFFEQLVTGAGLTQGDPVFALRRRVMIEPPRSSGAAQLRVNLGLFYKAWNLWRTGQQAQVIRMGRSEKVPTPVD